MSTFDDSKSPYNNPYDASKRYSEILFKPGKSAFNWEMLEMQSMQDHQMQLIGDSVFQEGAIISGMDVVPNAAGSGTLPLPDGVNANNFSLATLMAINDRIDTTSYTSDGSLPITTGANLITDYPGIQFKGTITKGVGATVSFMINKVSGTIHKLNFSLDSDKVTVKTFAIDGVEVATSPTDTTGTPLVDVNGNIINLDDGVSHQVTLSLDTTVTGDSTFQVILNSGYDAVAGGTIKLNLNELKVEDGYAATDWTLSTADDTTPNSETRSKNYTVNSGQIWLQGAVREFSSQDISITGVGTESIGVTLDTEKVTYLQDPDLLDHTSAAENSTTFGEEGADRKKYTVNLTYNDPNAVTLFTFSNNKLNIHSSKPDYTVINQILAKRTADESGSYVVSGFNASVVPDSLDSSKLILNVDAGTAYVNGYQVITSETVPVSISKATDSSNSTSEQYLYSSNYKLSNQPVQKINKVVASVQNTNSSVTRSSSGITDTFSTNPEVYQIVSVKQGGTTYVQGTDFSYSQNVITWGRDAEGNTLPNANVPSSNSSYVVVYNSTDVLIEGTDYKLVVDSSTNATSIVFDGMSGVKPISGSLVNVDYSFFYARIDMVTIKNVTSSDTSPFNVIEGTPAPLSTATPPSMNDPYSLELGYIIIYPDSTNAIFVSQTVKNIPFSELQKQQDRISVLEYNSALSNMESDASSSVDPLTYKDVFSDAFNTPLRGDTINPEFSVGYDLQRGEITPKIKASMAITPDIDPSSTTAEQTGQFITSSYTEVADISQNIATGVINVNPYDAYTIVGSLTVDPSSDNWIDYNNVVSYNYSSSPVTYHVDRYWDHRGRMTGDTSYVVSNVTLSSGGSWSQSNKHERTGTITSSGGSSSMDSAEEYMRSRMVSLDASNFLPNDDNLQVTIDGKAVLSPTPSSDLYKGTTANTFKADGEGNVKGTFVIPSGIKCGTRTIKIYNDTSVASTTYTAYGTQETVESVVNVQQVTLDVYDPVAQSFTYNDLRFLTSVGLYFNRTPNSNLGQDSKAGKVHPQLEVQIRKLSDDGQTPGNTIVAHTTLSPDDINVSKDASLETRVYFNDIVQLDANQAYCLVIVTDSDDYFLFKATKGENIIGSSSKLLGRPSDNGNLFTSSNSQSWLVDPSSSLKYNIYTARFSESSNIAFTPLTLKNQKFTDGDTSLSPVSINRLALLTAYLTPDNTNMSWYIRYVSSTDDLGVSIESKSWEAINAINGDSNSTVLSDSTNPYADELTFLSNTRQIQLMAKITATNYVSPKLALSCLTLAGILNDTTGNYVSIGLAEQGTAAYNHVNLQYDAYIPSGSSVVPYYSTDGGSTWYTFSTDGKSEAVPESTQPVSALMNRYVYNATVPTATDVNHLATQVKYKLVMSAPSQYVLPRASQLVSILSQQ